MSSLPRAIFFDLDDTLLDHQKAQRSGALQFQEEHALTQWEPDHFVQHWDALMQEHIAPYFAGQISFKEHRRRRMRALFPDTTLSEDRADAIFATYIRHYEGAWQPFDDALPCLEALRGTRLGIISNGDAPQQHRKLKALGIESHFATCLFSGDLGFAKPDPRIFQEACRRFDLPPGDCLMVGDNWEWDIVGARAIGMQAVWLCRTSPPPPHQPGMRSLSELVTALCQPRKA